MLRPMLLAATLFVVAGASAQADDTCHGSGQRVALRGTLASQEAVNASGQQRTQYVLTSDQPVCVHEAWQDKPAADEQISQFQIIGSPPFPLGVPVDVKGLIFTAQDQKKYVLPTTIEVFTVKPAAN